MAKVKICIHNGKPLEIEAERFTFYINNVRFWFAVHESKDSVGVLTISELETGMRVTDIPYITRAASPTRSNKELAKKQLESFCSEKTHQRVYDAIIRAHKAKYGLLGEIHEHKQTKG